MPAAAAFVAAVSHPVATAFSEALRLALLPCKQARRVGRRRILQKAQKVGLGAFVLLMGASLLAMRPHPAVNSGQDPRITAAHLKLAAVSPAAREDVD